MVRCIASVMAESRDLKDGWSCSAEIVFGSVANTRVLLAAFVRFVYLIKVKRSYLDACFLVFAMAPGWVIVV